MNFLLFLLALVFPIAVPVVQDGVQDVHDPLAGWTVQDVQIGATPQPTGPGLPVRLKISVIGLDSVVEYVGQSTDGAMGVPTNQDDVGWFQLGQRPGEVGTAVIDGHYGYKDGKPSAFDDLHKLRAGDEVIVEDDRGVTRTFVVRAIRRYDPKADAAGIFTSSDDAVHLNLITCEGVWDTAQNGYPQRLVVFTDELTP